MNSYHLWLRLSILKPQQSSFVLTIVVTIASATLYGVEMKRSLSPQPCGSHAALRTNADDSWDRWEDPVPEDWIVNMIWLNCINNLFWLTKYSIKISLFKTRCSLAAADNRPDIAGGQPIWRHGDNRFRCNAFDYVGSSPQGRWERSLAEVLL